MPRRLKVVIGGTGVPASTPSFPGDPGLGKYYVGWDEPSTIAAGNTWTPSPPGLSVYHTYAGANYPSTTDVDTAHNAGKIASHTFRLPITPAQVLAGTGDAQFDAFAAACIARAPKPIWLCYRHEPESEFTTAQAQTDYRAAYRYIVQRFRNAGVKNVSWYPIFMNPWTFDAASGRDWRNYHPDWNGSGWNGDIMMNFIGLDTYSPLPGSTSYQDFTTMMDKAFAKIEVPGNPVWDYVVPEFGMSNEAVPTPDWTAYGNQVRTYATARRIKWIGYWNNALAGGGATDHYSFDAQNDPNGTKLAAWRNICSGASTY